MPAISSARPAETGRTGDPLIDTLFRSTVADLSAAPVRTPGSHVRAGNAMLRSRAALLDGARKAVVVAGTRITMSQVAAAAGIAKATLYNHFRTRDAVLSALLDAEVDAVLAVLVDRPLPEALAAAASALSDHPLLGTLNRLEPGTAAVLARVDLTHPVWCRVGESLSEVLAEFDRRGSQTVLRWLASFVLAPASPAAIARDVEVLIAGLPSRHR